MNHKIIAFVLFINLFFICFCCNLSVAVATENFGTAKIFSLLDGKLENELNFTPAGLNYSASTIDLGGDGQDEILIGNGRFESPMVKIMRSDGSTINSFLAYDKNFLGGVKVAGCDFNGDGQGEVLTSAGEGGTAHIRIFNGYGEPIINAGFFAFDKKYHHGAEVACVDINGDKNDEIVAVAEESNNVIIKIFSSAGELIKSSKLNFKNKEVNLSSIDLGGDGKEEILVAGGKGNEAKVIIYRGDLSLVNELKNISAQNYLLGLHIFGFDVDQNKTGEIVTGFGIAGGSRLKITDGWGEIKTTLPEIQFAPEFNGGLIPLVGNFDQDTEKEIMILPESLISGRADVYKYIDVDVSDQRFRYYQNGYLINDVLTSSGKPSTPTRLGEFTAFSKYDMAYGGADGQRWGMPYFIGFYKSGGLENGIHELPFLNGRREGETSLGRAVSHGCVRLGIGEAKKVYDWVEIDKTKVIVHK